MRCARRELWLPWSRIWNCSLWFELRYSQNRYRQWFDNKHGCSIVPQLVITDQLTYFECRKPHFSCLWEITAGRPSGDVICRWRHTRRSPGLRRHPQLGLRRGRYLLAEHVYSPECSENLGRIILLNHVIKQNKQLNFGVHSQPELLLPVWAEGKTLKTRSFFL